MEIKIRKNGVYTPTWRGNDKLPANEQIKFYHRFLTNDERDDYIYLKPVTLQQINDGEGLNREYVQDSKGIAKLITTSIENLSVNEDGKTKKIDDIKKFYEYSFPLLAAEYEAYLLNISQVVDSKNGE